MYTIEPKYFGTIKKIKDMQEVQVKKTTKNPNKKGAENSKMIEKFRFQNFGIIKLLLAKLTKGNQKIMLQRTQDRPLRLQDAKID